MMAKVADTEGLRLLKAFTNVQDPKARRVIIEIVEAAAEGATIVLDENGTFEASTLEEGTPS